MKALAVGCLLMALPGWANEQEIRKALIERDQRSAEFARPAMEEFRQRQPQSDDRDRVTRERDAFVLTVEQERKSGSDPDYRPAALPSPLPGRPAGAVDPIPVQRGGG